MKAIRILAVALATTFAPCLTAHGADAAPAAAPAETASLETAIPYGIKLLEAKEYKAFLQAFVPPDMYKAMTEGGSDEFVKHFAEGRAEKLLAVMKGLKDAKPTLEEDGKKANYKLGEEIAGKKSIQFIRIGTNWYINN